jgi:hypothetical protein
MSETRKPRHIRDIAHLYLSRMQAAAPPVHDRIVLCGDSRNCLPAIHVANIAAAFALGGAGANPPLAVRVFDVSGLLPNAGYYLGLPPQVYIGHRSGNDSALQPALIGISVGFDRSAAARANQAPARAVFEVVHIPPFEFRDPFSEALAELGREPVENTFFVLLQSEARTLDGVREIVSSRLRNAPCFGIGVEWTEDGWFRERIGTVSGWKSNAADRIPIVCRDPHSIPARRYHSLVDGLANKIRLRRRVNREPAIGGLLSGRETG